MIRRGIIREENTHIPSVRPDVVRRWKLAFLPRGAGLNPSAMPDSGLPASGYFCCFLAQRTSCLDSICQKHCDSVFMSVELNIHSSMFLRVISSATHRILLVVGCTGLAESPRPDIALPQFAALLSLCIPILHIVASFLRLYGVNHNGDNSLKTSPSIRRRICFPALAREELVRPHPHNNTGVSVCPHVFFHLPFHPSDSHKTTCLDVREMWDLIGTIAPTHLPSLR
jgi:hypothetical protein